MFTFDRKPRPSTAHSPAPKPASQRPAQAPLVNPSGFRKASLPVAPGPQFDFARIPTMPPSLQHSPTISSLGGPYEREAKRPSLAGDEGESLSAATRTLLEPSLGNDLGRVRVHAGGDAARMARELGARAFTLGSHVFFGAGRYKPETIEGLGRLTHEVAHTLQQTREDPGEVLDASSVQTGRDERAEGEARVASSAILRGQAARIVERRSAALAFDTTPEKDADWHRMLDELLPPNAHGLIFNIRRIQILTDFFGDSLETVMRAIYAAPSARSFVGEHGLGAILALGETASGALLDVDKARALLAKEPERYKGANLQNVKKPQPPATPQAPSQPISKTTSQPIPKTTSQPVQETDDLGGVHTQQLELERSKLFGTPKAVNIVLGVNWTRDGTWPTWEAFKAFVQRVKDVSSRYMNGKFKIHCEPLQTKSDRQMVPLDLPISIRLEDDANGFTAQCHGGEHGKSEVKYKPGKGGAAPDLWANLYELGQTGEKGLPDVTIAHEMGHAVLGASDEYANAAAPRNRFISKDHSIMGDYYTQGIAQAEFKVRHFRHILAPIAAQLPDYKCTLVPA